MIFTHNDYITKGLEATIGCHEFIADFANPQRFEQCCRECPAYGRWWGCPPHDIDWNEKLAAYSRVLIVGTKITPRNTSLPADVSLDLMRPETDKLNRRLLDMEREQNGTALGFAGKCPYCGELPCTRPQGLPCRHPELVRPSLEAVGFDVERTCRELLGVPLQWSSDGNLPPYLVIVGALFHH